MSPKLSAPKIDPRTASKILEQLREMVPHYTREWPARDENDPGVALLRIFSSIAEGVVSRLNRAPERNFLAFLDVLGIRRLPATPARAPVRFLVAKGTEDPFEVPLGTQVSAGATPKHPELPFETLKTLWAIPSTLLALMTVDPEADRIYQAPPGFLALELAASELPLLSVTAFCSAGSNFLQLDPPGQVAEGDFLRIEQVSKVGSSGADCIPKLNEQDLRIIDHLVVGGVKGPIVTVTDPLPRDYVEDTKVRKETQFELFEAKNWQEHVLYLAHADYFAIKSEAQFELSVEHAAGISANLEPLKVVWEFFGATEAEKEKGDTWHQFAVDVDGTEGLSRNGRIILNKPAGEIKETEINGYKSRWIRARLDDPLPAAPGKDLPKLDSITFKVSLGGAGLVADQAFNNDTPLTTDVPFFPFGTEPRIFDRFDLASAEAFSKPGADISLNFSMDTTQLLASPSAVLAKDKVRVFATAVAGKLLEFRVDPSTFNVETDRHGNPKDTRITAGSSPAVVVDSSEEIVGAFVRADDGKIHLRHIRPIDPADPATNPSWKPLVIPPGTLQFNPAAIPLSSGRVWQVFAVADNKLYMQTLIPTQLDLASHWSAIVDSPKIDSSPFVLEVSGVAVVFVTDLNGNTWMLRNTWTDLTPKLDSGQPNPDYVAAKNARPFVRAYKDQSDVQQFRIFLRNKNNELVALDTVKEKIRNLGAPDTRVGSNPFGSSVNYSRIYVRGETDSRLWSIEDAAGKEWTEHGTTNDVNLDGDPFVIAYPKTGEFVSAFSTSKKNAMLEFRASSANVGSGKIQAGPNDIVLLKDKPTAPGTYYIHVLSGPGANSSADAVRKIKRGTSRFVVLESPLEDSATTETKYDLLRKEASGQVKAATTNTLTLQGGAGSLVEDGDYLFVRDQLRRIPTAPATDDVVKISGSWYPLPTSTDTYLLLRVDKDTSGDTASGISALRAVLDPSVNQPNHAYRNKFLLITSGPGQSPLGRRIDDYFHSTNDVVLASEFAQPPTNASTYAITLTSVPEAWYVYKDPDQAELRPQLSWEYWNGRGWLALTLEKDETDRLLVDGSITFTLPDGIAKTEVAGQDNFWIRARIVGGDYGREQVTIEDSDKIKKIKVEKDPIRPPLVKSLTITYKLTELKPPQFCLTLNNLSYLDQTASNLTRDKHFYPYVPLDDKNKAVYFGFDREFEGGPVRIYFAAKELEVDERNKPKLNWEFAFNNDWAPLRAEDDSDAFTKPDFLTLNMPSDFQNSQQFGQALYWLRATLAEGSWSKSPLFTGVFVNTVEAQQARTITNELLGSSTGVKSQLFKFQQVPVLAGEEVRVREALTDEERDQLVKEQGEVSALTVEDAEQQKKEQGKDTVLSIKDQEGRVLQTWIRWTEVQEFFSSGSTDRHYRLDRASGEIEFGDGIHGRIPPAGGENIQAFSYQAGGGAAGNVAFGEITSPVSAVAGVDSVINPVAAGGGSEAATMDEMLEIGPAQISHRERAVTPEDFERLAREASREVRKARCLPNRNANGRHELGWTSVFIVPDATNATPSPSLELRRAVQRYLADRADLTVVDQKHIFVGAPEYVPVSVDVKVFAKSIDAVAAAELSVQQKLEKFLHPLNGGPLNEGWDFGRDLAASDLYSLLEDIPEVDHVASLKLSFGGSQSSERVEVGADALLASGTHKISMDVAVGD